MQARGTNHLDFFRFVGRVVGKALHDGQTIDAYFTRSFYKHCLGQPLTYQARSRAGLFVSSCGSGRALQLAWGADHMILLSSIPCSGVRLPQIWWHGWTDDSPP